MSIPVASLHNVLAWRDGRERAAVAYQRNWGPVRSREAAAAGCVRCATSVLQRAIADLSRLRLRHRKRCVALDLIAARLEVEPILWRALARVGAAVAAANDLLLLRALSRLRRQIQQRLRASNTVPLERTHLHFFCECTRGKRRYGKRVSTTPTQAICGFATPGLSIEWAPY